MRAKDEGLECVLILEDDVKLVPNFLKLWDNYMGALAEFDMAYFNGYPHRKLFLYNDFWRVCRRMTGAFAYVVHANMYDYLIDLLSVEDVIVDVKYSKIQENFKCFLSTEKIVRHLDGYSLRAEQKVEYPTLR